MNALRTAKAVLTRIPIAWWIAFGPHGPRAETPPGEWGKIWFYTTIGVAVAVTIFFLVHSFARPPPRTMTKEWQEATNEYLKVWFIRRFVGYFVVLITRRENESTRFTVSLAKATQERDMYKASLPSHRASRLSQTMNRCRFTRSAMGILQSSSSVASETLHCTISY